MTQILIFILGFIAGGVAIWFLKSSVKKSPGQKSIGKKKPSTKKASAGNLKAHHKKRQETKKVRKEKILALYSSRKKRVTNNNVEKLLGVSDATATRYLEELEREGKVIQVGRTGKHVYYKLK